MAGSTRSVGRERTVEPRPGASGRTRRATTPGLASAAWPPLILLVASVLAMTLVGAGWRAPVLAAIPAAALLWLALNNVYSLDGLGHEGWSEYRAGGISSLGNARRMEHVALGDFQSELDAIRESAGPHGRILGADGRLGFFLPGTGREHLAGIVRVAHRLSRVRAVDQRRERRPRTCRRRARDRERMERLSSTTPDARRIRRDLLPVHDSVARRFT